VTEGHPDKIADQISDAVLDAVLADDPTGRVACEVLVTTGLCIVAGEITTKTYVDIPEVARGTIEYVGYTDASYGFDNKTCGVLNAIQRQSPHIAMGVDTGGAGDHRHAGAKNVRIAVLVDKTHDRKARPDLKADYVGMPCVDRYVFGYGMDYKGYWRNAPGIYAVKGL
jgi:S-adenosylmethionine synthetase